MELLATKRWALWNPWDCQTALAERRQIIFAFQAYDEWISPSYQKNHEINKNEMGDENMTSLHKHHIKLS